MERLGATKKRLADSDEREVTPAICRRQTSDALQYLREKNERESVLKKDEMDLKKKEFEQRLAQQQVMEDQHKQLQQQQQNMLMMMQQQQQKHEQQLQNFQALFLQQQQQQQQQNQVLARLLEKNMH